MAVDILKGSNVDMNKNYLLNLGIQTLPAAPTSPIDGQIYIDSVTKQFRHYDAGTATWFNCTNQVLSALVTATEPIQIAPNGQGIVVSISAASATNAGSMSDADFTKLANATNAATASTLAMRDSAGRLQVATPVSSADAANKAYVDSLVSGKDWKDSVRLATTTNITTSGTPIIDGIQTVVGDRVLVKDQTNPGFNNIYVVTTGAWSYAPDADSNAEVTSGMTCLVEQGTVNGSTGWTLTTPNPISVGATSLNFTKTMQSAVIIAGTGMTQTGNTFDVVAADGSIQVNSDNIQVRIVASGGLSVTAGGLSVTNYTPVTNTIVSRKWVSTPTALGGGTAVSFTHNLNTTAVQVDVYDTSGNRWEMGVTVNSANTVQVFKNGASQNFTVVVTG